MSRKWLAALVLAIPASSASAVCIHNGKFYAKTTLAEEFNESRWVVRALVESGHTYIGQPTSWTLYRLRLVHSFKGAPSPRFRFYTRRDSGGFYMDDSRGRPDAGRDYLLFLNPAEVSAEDPSIARGAMWVNYECGKSKPWADVTTAEREKLSALQPRSR